MKFSTVSFVALGGSLVAASPVNKAETEAVDYKKIIKSQIERRQAPVAVPGLPPALAGFVPMIANMGVLPMVVKGLNSGYGKMPEVKTAIPKKAELKSRMSHIKDSKTVKIRYGPYKVPSSARKNGLGEAGTLFNWPELNVDRPCTGDCILLSMEADLEYADGTNANTGNGMWLHHMVLFNVGPNRFDPTCVGKVSLPHALISSSPAKAERVMASGNERTRARFNSPYQPQEKLGYYVNKEDKFALILDFMNEKPEDRIVYLTMTFDYVDGRPEGFSNFRTIWLDVAQCGTSEVPAPAQSGQFKVSQGWTANLNADILGGGGHLHDGGTHITLTVDGKEICNSKASYAKTNSTGAMGGMGAMGGGGMAMGRVVSDLEHLTALEKRDGPHLGGEHISGMSPCVGQTMGLGKIQKGQKWEITGHYDLDKHAGMKMNGKQSNVMGIVLLMVKNWTA